MSSRWRYGYHTVLIHRCVQGRTLYMRDKFGEDRSMCVGVIRTSCFMAKDQNWRRCHAHTVLVIKKAFDNFSSPMCDNGCERV